MSKKSKLSFYILVLDTVSIGIKDHVSSSALIICDDSNDWPSLRVDYRVNHFLVDLEIRPRIIFHVVRRAIDVHGGKLRQWAGGGGDLCSATIAEQGLFRNISPWVQASFATLFSITTYSISLNAIPGFFFQYWFLGLVLFKFGSHGIVIEMGLYYLIQGINNVDHYDS